MQQEIKPVTEVDTPRVVCDGGGKLGHPKVYMEFGNEDTVDCPYCGHRFVLRTKANRH